jgi:acetoin utilization deacetylase AcuC-like enzyme
VSIIEDFQDGQLGDIIAAHDGTYVLHIQKVCAGIPEGSILNIDPDTAVSTETWPSAIKAVGAVVEACKLVMEGKFRNAFCPIRPPGHHSGIFGVVDMCSKELKKVKESVSHYHEHKTNGFCIFNNIGVAAAYLKNVH